MFWQFGHCKNGKFHHTYLPDKFKFKIRLKKIDEFRKEQIMVVPLAAIRQKSNYFESMDYVSGGSVIGNTGVGNTIKDYGGGVGDAVPGMPGQTKQWEWLGERVLDK